MGINMEVIIWDAFQETLINTHYLYLLPGHSQNKAEQLYNQFLSVKFNLLFITPDLQTVEILYSIDL